MNAFFSNGKLNCFDGTSDIIEFKNFNKRDVAVFFDRDGIVNIDAGYVQ